MHKFTHISAFYQVVRSVEQMREDPEFPEHRKIRSPVRYRGTVKLHGSNAGVTCTNEGLVAQSRSRVITPSDDNYGFAAFVEGAADSIHEIAGRVREAQRVDEGSSLVLFGEWVGPGIQSGVALTGLQKKQWVLFAVRVVSGEEGAYVDAVPELGDEFAGASIFSVMDGPRYELRVDFSDARSKEFALDQATRATHEVEACCPWAKRFGVEGVGEGIVWVPVDTHWGNSDLFFKSKGEKHQVVKTKTKRPQLNPEVLQSIDEFIEFALTDVRLVQGLHAVSEMGHSLEMASIVHFLKWVGQDVRRECEAELSDNGLDWKIVSKAVTHKARRYFVDSIHKAALA